MKGVKLDRSSLEKYLSPDFVKETKNLKGNEYLGRVVSCLKKSISSKLMRIQHFISSKGEWINNKLVLKEINKNIESLNEGFSSRQMNIRRIKKEVINMRLILQLLSESGAEKVMQVSYNETTKKKQTTALLNKETAALEELERALDINSETPPDLEETDNNALFDNEGSGLP